MPISDVAGKHLPLAKAKGTQFFPDSLDFTRLWLERSHVVFPGAPLALEG